MEQMKELRCHWVYSMTARQHHLLELLLLLMRLMLLGTFGACDGEEKRVQEAAFVEL